MRPEKRTEREQRENRERTEREQRENEGHQGIGRFKLPVFSVSNFLRRNTRSSVAGKFNTVSPVASTTPFKHIDLKWLATQEEQRNKNNATRTTTINVSTKQEKKQRHAPPYLAMSSDSNASPSSFKAASLSSVNVAFGLMTCILPIKWRV